jgi:NAD(P)-dependent dehydrogenase (short-subunit alcohol dehydrogenase family)
MTFLDERARLTGRVAVVLGGGGGIGAAVSLALAGAGVDLAICDLDGDALDATRRSVEALGRRVLAQRADVTEAAQLNDFYAAVAKFFNTVDIIVNVAGGVRKRPFMDSTAAQCEADIRRNYGYVVDSVRHAVPLLRRSGRGGSIISFTTIEAHRGAAGFAVYAGAKAATTNFMRAMAVELGAEGIRLNTIAPDTTPSQGNMNALPPEMLQRLAALPAHLMDDGLRMYIPMKRPPSVDDLANAVLFLASDLAASITGTTLHVDGGTMAAAGFIDWPHGDGSLPVPMAGSLPRLFP